MQDALSALLNLGYPKNMAEKALDAAKALGAGTLEDLLRQSLKMPGEVRRIEGRIGGQGAPALPRTPFPPVSSWKRGTLPLIRKMPSTPCPNPLRIIG